MERSNTLANDGHWDRRAVLRAAAVMAGAAVTAPLLGVSAIEQAGPSSDADALFKAGEFEQAGRAYEEILKQDPRNVHAARQRGYVGLLANKFADAEKYLEMAITLAPDDREANRFLADCYTRQDRFSLAALRRQAAGDDAYAKLLAAIRGTPYEIHGDIARAPWQQMDPSPLVEVSLNGGPPQSFAFYTRVAMVGMSAKVAEEAGLRAVAEVNLGYIDPPRIMYFGVLDSAAAKDAYCIAIKRSAKAPHGFDVLGHFSHSFYKPYNITLDFTDMNLYIVRGKAT
jgi:tetratricopeptide (TPR) repeat protein